MPATELRLLPDGGRLDPVMEAASLAPKHPGLALVPEVGTARSEPLRVSTMLATLDFVSHGLAGWLVDPGPDLDQAADHVDVVRALWDSWEDGAEIRDGARSRFLDPGRLHETLDAGGERFAIRGPSITPRPPQGHPPVLVRVYDVVTLALAERAADVALSDGFAWGERAREAGLTVLEQSSTGALHGVWAGQAPTLRERLGLLTAINRYAVA